jgi:hypothetical protein
MNRSNKTQFKDIEAELNALLDGLESYETDLLQVVRDTIRVEMAAKVTTKSNTNSIRNSIQAVQTADNLQIQIVDYGMFQNYGVQGLESGSAIPNHEGYTYKFGVKAENKIKEGKAQLYWKTWKYGIKARRWFDVEEVLQKIEEELKRRLEA